MFKQALTAIFISTIGCNTGTPTYAEVTYDKTTHTMRVSGDTDPKLYADVKAVVDKEDVFTVIMYGNGGHVFSGMDIGYLLKDEGVTVTIPKFFRCVSTCALSAMAADNLIIEGSLWFHRPYIRDFSIVTTLETILSLGGRGGVYITNYVNQIGYDISFTAYLLNNTNLNTFAVVEDAEELLKYRFDPDTTTVAEMSNYEFKGEGFEFKEF